MRRISSGRRRVKMKRRMKRMLGRRMKRRRNVHIDLYDSLHDDMSKILRRRKGRQTDENKGETISLTMMDAVCN